VGESLRAPFLLEAAAFVFGLVIGSFVNVVVHRLPLGASVVVPGSHCPSCRRPLRPWENVPLLSYLVQRGRCRGCGVRISLRYPAVELGTGLVFAAVAFRYGASPLTPVLMLFAAALVAAALIDFEHHIIPDEISLGGLLAGLSLMPVLETLQGTPLREAVCVAVAGALLGGGTLWTVGFVHARVSAALGRTFEHWPEPGEELPRPGSLDYWTWFPGMGFGDVKLMAMIGAFLGVWGTLATIFGAALLGLLMGLVFGLVRRSLNAPFGLAPAISASALLVLLSPTGSLPF
jgi:leader peptidase (prepilin peptidase)/N-methyltransferase